MEVVSRPSIVSALLRPIFFRWFSLFFSIIAFTLLLAIFVPLQASAATFIVNTTNDTSDSNPGNGGCSDSTGACSLRAAIEESNASPGSDTIQVPIGVYTLSGLGQLEIKGDVSIVGASGNVNGNPAQTIIQAAATPNTAANRVFEINPSLDDVGFQVSFKALTIRNGKAPDINGYGGGGIAGDTGTSTITIANSIIEENIASNHGYGGGMYFSGKLGGSVVLDHTIIRNNSAGTTTPPYRSKGGGVYVEGDVNLQFSYITVENNTSFGLGGGLAIIPQSQAARLITISDSTISSNKAKSVIRGADSEGRGAGIYLNSPATLTNTGISGNNADGDGGGLVLDFYNGAVALNSVTIAGNGNYGRGGGLYINGYAPPVLTGTTITSNTNLSNSAASDVGANPDYPDLKVTASHTDSFKQGQTGATYSLTVQNAGAVGSNGTVTVTDTLPAGLTATGMSGAGWSCDPGSLTCTRNGALAAGQSYPVILLTVNVAADAAASVTNTAVVAGAGIGELNTFNNSAIDVTTITQNPNLSVVMSHTGDFRQGQTGAAYTITVTNGGMGPTSSTVTVSGALPEGLKATAISGTGWTCDLITLICTRSDALAAGQSYPAITLTMSVSSNASASLTSGATVSGGGDVSSENNAASDPTTVEQVADLVTAVNHIGNFRQGQTGAEYTIAVTNAGTGATSGVVTVTSTLPTGLTATAMSGTGWTCNAGTLTCTRSDVLAAGQSYPVITMKVNVEATAAASLTNTIEVSGGGEVTTGNNTGSDLTIVEQAADLVVKASHIDNFTQGQIGAAYTFIVSNNGNGPTAGAVTAAVYLPIGLTATAMSGTDWSCDAGTLTCTRNDALVAGQSYPDITLTVAVAANAAASVTSTVTVSGGGELNTTNNSAEDVTSINQLPDMTVTMSHTGDFRQGQKGVAYTITATNSGTGLTNGIVTVNVTLPTGLTATAMSGTGWTCDTDTLTCTRSDALAAGQSYDAITLTVDVAATAAASLTSSVTVTGGGDTNSGNNTVGDLTTVAQAADLVAAVNHIGNFRQGQTGAEYTIAVTNAGTGATSGVVTVTSTLPTGLTATAMSGTGWTCNAGTLTCTRSDVLAAGQSYPVITMKVNVEATAAASLTNTIEVSGGGEVTTGNNTGSDLTIVEQAADLVVKASHIDNFTQGQIGAAYTFIVSNNGNGPTAGAVTAVVYLPIGLTATAMNGLEWSCDAGTLTCTRSDVLGAGQSHPAITLTVDVAANASDSVTSTVTVSGGGELNTTNNSAEDVTSINQLPDMTVTMSHTGDFRQGQKGVAYTITATNSGTGLTNGIVTVNVTLPTGLTATAMSGTGWTCDTDTLTCTRSDALAAGQSYDAITLTVDVAATAAASLTSSVTVTGGGDTNSGNNTVGDLTTVAQAADLVAAVNHIGNFRQGQTGAEYTIAVTNAGTGATSGVVTVTSTLPTGLAATAMSGTGWTCNAGTLTCTRSDVLAAGQSYPVITMKVNVEATAAASLTNTIEVSGGGEVTTGNNTGSDLTIVEQAADLVVKASHIDNFTQGQIGAAYTFIVSNNGNGPTAGAVTAAVYLPIGLTATAMSGTDWSCDAGTLTCTRSDALVAGQSYPDITLTVAVAANAAASVTSTVTVSGGGELNTTNNSAEDVTSINQLPDMTVTMSHTGDFRQGQKGVAYTITATNSGTGLTNGIVTVNVTLPTGLTATAMSGTGWTCDTDTLTCTRSDALAAGQSYDAITLTVNVAATAAASLTSSVTVAGGNDTNTGNNTASDLTTVALAADLIVAQSQSGAFVQVQKGATYTITVTNNKGAGTTSGAVTVTDILPMGLIATAMDGMGWTCNAGTLTCTRSDALAADQSYPAITLTVDVASDAPATLTNKVEVSGGGELNVSNNIDTGVNSVYHRPELIALTLSSGTIALSSAFRPETFNYNANVGNLVESTTVTATTYDDSTSRLEITLNGKSYASGDSIPIHAGQNEILLKVTSTINNTTSQTYTINVTRASSSNAELSDLRLSSDNVSSFISISPMFSPTQVNYQASVTDSVYQVYVYATPNDAYSSITVSGATYGASLSGGIPVRLSLDSETLITIEVTAQDRSKTETYTIKVLRAAIIGSGNGNEIRVTFSDAIRPAGINLEKFKVNINNQTVSVSQAVYDYSDRLGRTVVLKLEREIRYGESISLEIADGAVKYLNNTDSSKTSVQVTNSVILSMQIRRELAALDAEHDGIGINEILKWINNNKYDLTGDGKFDSKDVMLLLQQIDRVRH